MANVKITDLPAAGALAGTEQLETVQAGVSVQTTAAAVSSFNKVAAFTSGTINGVAIGGTTPGTGLFTYKASSVAAAVTAAGTTNANAFQLVAQFNRVTTAASSAVGVVLPLVSAVGVGGFVYVANDGPSNAFHVYGAGSDTVDGNAAATGISITNPKLGLFVATAAATWISYSLGSIARVS